MTIKKTKKELQEYFMIFIVVLFIIIVFTLFDYWIHTLDEDYGVPSYYYRNKIIYGTIIGFITYLFVKKQKPFKSSLIFSGIIAVLLQIRYTIEGYALDFVVLFLFIHFLILLVISYHVFKILKDKLI